MSEGPPPPKRGKVWERPGLVQGGAHYDLAANVLVGLALGWGAQKLWPGLKPWGYAGGIVLGSISGFYQLFKAQQRSAKQKKQG